jgi:hypothetical protein
MKCGDATIDGLLAADVSVQPLSAGVNSPAVGYLQDLLRGHGFEYLPDPRVPGYGAYGSATTRAVSDYKRQYGLEAATGADSNFVRDIVARPADQAAVGPAYTTLVLDVAFTPILRFVWLTSLFETGGVFARLNLNTDRCGVSFGVLQWAQRAGQLHNVLQACSEEQSEEWARIMGIAGAGLLEYAAKPNGGLDADGLAIDAAYELTKEPWRSRLQALGASQPMQRVQLQLATDAYYAELGKLRAYLKPDASERTVAFLLDLSNQFGPWRVQQHYETAAAESADECSVLKKIEDNFAAIARPQFQAQVRARREFFRTTRLLSDVPLAA